MWQLTSDEHHYLKFNVARLCHLWKYPLTKPHQSTHHQEHLVSSTIIWDSDVNHGDHILMLGPWLGQFFLHFSSQDQISSLLGLSVLWVGMGYSMDMVQGNGVQINRPRSFIVPWRLCYVRPMWTQLNLISLQRSWKSEWWYLVGSLLFEYIFPLVFNKPSPQRLQLDCFSWVAIAHVSPGR